MSVQYRYEYGQHWNAALPRNDIAFLVHRMHSATDDDRVAADILDRCKRSGIPARMWPACQRYALAVHHEQKKLYYNVLRGNL